MNKVVFCCCLGGQIIIANETSHFILYQKYINYVHLDQNRHNKHGHIERIMKYKQRKIVPKEHHHPKRSNKNKK